ncbi:MAG: Maf family protein [Pirellulaceae bacterium]|nr:Maf family protein [Pirellulaceae bacterium]
MKLILASQSPRRRQLMQQVGYEFEIIVPSESAECGLCSGESTPELVARYAYQKAVDIRPRIDGEAIIIACDTVADIEGQMLGKPRDREHAEYMLRLLSGRVHRVFSGLCVWQVPVGEPDVRVAKSELIMDRLSEAQIQAYLDSDDWIGKSGAFGYQDGHPWLKLVSGTASNVVGLPLDLLREMLAPRQRQS